MKYISGRQALNINCNLDTCGDWHSTCQDWRDLDLRESEDSVFGTWGIEGLKSVPHNRKKYHVANHIRAILDMLESNQLSLAQGMRNDFICNEDYTELLFEKVCELQEMSFWPDIYDLMAHEYYMKWVDYYGKSGKGTEQA